MSPSQLSAEFVEAIHHCLGYAPPSVEPGRFYRFPTSAKRGDLAGWCRLYDSGRGGVFGCHRSGLRQHWVSSLSAQGGTPWPNIRDQQTMARAAQAKAQQAAQQAANAHRIQQVWTQCAPARPGSPVDRYLRRRGLVGIGGVPADLRSHEALPYWENGRLLGRFPAMVAQLHSPAGKVLSLHRTFLTPDGLKLPVSSPKKLCPSAGPLAGSSIRVHKLSGSVVGVAEGIETALAATLLSGIPTLAAYCASNLETWQWPTGANEVVVFADADSRGLIAAANLKARVLRAGLVCSVLVPAIAGNDWADVWLNGQGGH